MRVQYTVLTSLFFTAIGVFFLFSVFGCVPYQTPTPTEGSHGLRTFYTDNMVSFTHTGQRICVPSGWRALGAHESFGGATFPRGKTGVFVKENAFAQELISEQKINGYAVRFLYPKETPTKDIWPYIHMITRSFDTVGSMYAPQKEERSFTVVLTVGVSDATALYPDPTEKVAYITRSHEDPRSEELLLHAVAHLYNRFDLRFANYTTYQSPLSPGDFEELEATWAETAFNSSETRTRARLAYLYGEYTQSTSSESAEARKHYTVSPLVMIAIEGLLQRSASPADVRAILAKVHQGTHVNFFDEIAGLLGTEQLARIERWLHEEERIPYDLLLSGIRYYEHTPY